MPATAARRSRTPVLLMGAGGLVLLAIVAATLLLSWRTSDLANDVLESRAVRAAAYRVLETLLNAETGQRGYLLTAQPAYLAPYTEARARAETDMTELRGLSRDDSAVRFDMAPIEALIREKLTELDNTVALFQAGRRTEALGTVQSGRGKTVMDEARRRLAQVIDNSDTVLGDSIIALNRNAAILRVVTAVGGLLIVLFAGAAIVLLLRAIREAVTARVEVETLNTSLEQRVLDRTAALTRANDEIQRFAYIVSHDLRAPLVNIMGFTSEMEVATGDLQKYFADERPETRPPALEAVNADLPQAVKFIRSSTVKMDRLINAILKLSREGRRELTPERVDLGKVFEALLGSLKHQIDDTRTVASITTVLPVIETDRLALEQVFGNLLDNALKYLQPGRPGRIGISATRNRGMIAITVADNGRGIAEQDRERVFELFRRAGRQDQPGEGIGLAHVRALVRRLGGDITVTSRLGEGSEFRVTLPSSLPTEQSAS